MQEIEPIKHPDEKLFPKKDKLPLKDFLEIVGKGAVYLSVACYLMGFIVVNAHFNRFGYYSVSLVSAQYLIAGIWAIGPVIVGWFVVLFNFKDVVELSTKTQGPSVLLALLYISPAVTFLVLLLLSEQIAMLHILLRLAIIVAAGFFTSLPAVAFCRWLIPLESLSKEWILTVSLAFIVCFFTLAYLINFSRSLYGEIPGTWGGGRPRLVRIVVKSEAKEDLTAVGVSFPQGHSVSEPMGLLVVTDKEYILLTGRGDTSVSIQSDVIQAVSYQAR